MKQILHSNFKNLNKRASKNSLCSRCKVLREIDDVLLGGMEYFRV